MANEKEYMAVYKTLYGTIELGYYIPDSETTTDFHYFKASDDTEALKVADSYEIKNKIVNGRFTRDFPKLERLLETRDLELPKK